MTIISRHMLVSVLAMIGLFASYIIRVCLSIAIKEMTDTKQANHSGFTPFDWTETEKNAALGALFVGYLTTQLLGGWLASVHGGVTVFGTGICLASVFGLCIPFAVSTPSQPIIQVSFLILFRILQGFCLGVTYPSVLVMMSVWAPPNERSRLTSLIYSGSFYGTVISYPMTSYVANTWGWAFTFYVPSIMCLLWFVVWFFFISDSPEKDKWISAEEKEFLAESLKETVKKPKNIPLFKILTSPRVWAIASSHFCENYPFYAMMSKLYTYLEDLFDCNDVEAGILSGIPFLSLSIILSLGGYFSDFLKGKDVFSKTTLRKVFDCGGFLGQAAFMIAASLIMDSNFIIFHIFISLAIGLGAFVWVGFSVNPLDIGPQYAGVIMGVSNTVATISGVISPLITGFIVTNPERNAKEVSRRQFKIVLYKFAGISVVGAVLFALLATAELQPWAMNDGEDESDKQSTGQSSTEVSTAERAKESTSKGTN